MATFIYLRKQHNGYYFETPMEIDTTLWEGQIGETYKDFLNNKWIPLSQEQIQFHKDNPFADIKSVIEMEIQPAEERTLELAKEGLCKQIDFYNESDEVNSFSINGIDMWLTVNERQQIATQISASEAIGREIMTRWYNGIEFTFPLTLWKQMLVALEVYAGDALNVTEAHKAAVNALETIEDVDAYDYHTGYPQKLIFDSNN